MDTPITVSQPFNGRWGVYVGGEMVRYVETKHEADLAAAAFRMAHARGVREGIERVRMIGLGKSEGWADHPVESVCDATLAAFKQEQGDE